MSARIVMFLMVLGASCSGSVVVSEQAPPSPTPAIVAGDPSVTPRVVTDELGDWYVPTSPSIEAERAPRRGQDEDDILASINAGVPPEYDLAFEWRDLQLTDDHVARALVPLQWEKSDNDYEYEDDRLDFFTEYEIDTGCQGFCIAQVWENVMNDPASSPLRVRADQDIVVMLNQKLVEPAGRLIVTDRSAVSTGGDSIRVELVRWSDAADRFLQCDASFGEDDRTLWPTFADVCIAASAEWIDR